MLDKKRFVMINKFSLVILLLLILVIVIPFTFSKFSSTTSGNAKIETAFYILNASYFTEEINIDSLIPRDDPYIYSFTVSNNNGTDRLETKMNYNLEIITTTNLPLTYKLYLNDNHDTNIITEEEIVQDENDTYFKNLKTTSKTFGFSRDETDKYELYVYFPSTYTDFNYQDIVELITIKIESKQVLDGE